MERSIATPPYVGVGVRCQRSGRGCTTYPSLSITVRTSPAPMALTIPATARTATREESGVVNWIAIDCTGWDAYARATQTS
jgi:hypothetical protein